MLPKSWLVLAALTLLGLLLPSQPAIATLSATEPPFTISGTVKGLASDGGKTYVVGLFDAQRKVTGSGLILEAGGSGEPAPSSFPKVAGRINDVEPDGSGGWYIGGQFAGVGGLSRSNLAHVRADGSVDRAFAPDPDGPVDTLGFASGRLYVGGLFTKIDGVSRSGFAAVTPAGSLVDAFDPQLNSSPRVLVATAGTVYASGPFNETGGAGETSVVAVSAATGAATSFKVGLARPSETSGLVRSLSVVGGDLLIGGTFLTVNGQSRSLLARVDGTTGELRAWNAQVEGAYGSGTDSVAALTPVGDRLYLGGQFKKVGGQDRPWVAAVNLSTGAVEGWQPSGYTFGSNYEGVKQIAVSGDRVFLAGSFFVGPLVGFRKARAVAAVSASSGSLVSFDPGVPTDTNPPGAVSALATQSGKLYIGGMFAGAGTPLATRSDALRLNSDGSLDTTWTPPTSPSSNGWSWVAIGPDTVYLAQWPKLIAIDKTTGAEKPGFNPPAGIVGPLTLAGGKLYVTRSNTLAELDPATGAQSAWSPTFSGPSGNQILDVTADGGSLYVGGMFTSVDGATRKGLARFQLPSHTLGPASAIEGWVNSLIPFGRSLLVRGQLQRGGDFFDQRGGALSNLDTQAVAWWPTDTASVDSPDDSDVVFGDAPIIASWGGMVHRVAAHDITTGRLLEHTPLGTGGFGGIVATDQTRDWLGGNFLSVGTTVTGPLARVTLSDSEPAAPINTTAPSISGTPVVGSALTCSPGGWTGSPSFALAWLRGGAPIGGATAPNYVVSDADRGQMITCRVTASNAGGISAASSAPLSIMGTEPLGETPADPPKLPEGPTVTPVTDPASQPGVGLGGGPQVSGVGDPMLTVPKSIMLAKLKRGVTVRVSGMEPGSSIRAELRLGKAVLATRTTKANSTGSSTIRLKPSGTTLKKVKKKTKLRLRVRGMSSAGRVTTATRTLGVR